MKLSPFVFLIMILFTLLFVCMTCSPVDLVHESSTILHLKILISLNIFEYNVLNTFPWSNFGGIFFKNSIKADIISFSTTKCKNLLLERVVLTKEIIRLKAFLVAGDFSVSSAICDLENKLKQLVLKELSGVAIRSKGRWLKKGENLLFSALSWSVSVFSAIQFFLF